MELPAFFDEKLIPAVIANRDDDLKYKKKQIELFFSLHPEEDERAAYLKSAYQDRYTEIMVDGERVGYKPQEDGLWVWEGAYLSRKAESVFSWGVVAALTAQQIENKTYSINTSAKAIKAKDNPQVSLFDLMNEPLETGGNEQISIFNRFEISQQVIDEALCIGANDRESRLEICAYFMKDKEDNAAFLQKHYGENGAGFYLNDRKIAIWYDVSGIRIAEGESAQKETATLITWPQAAKRIRELLDLGRYMPQSELDKAAELECSRLADSLLLMFRDIEDEEKRFFPTLHAFYDAPGGFPEMVKKVDELLERPDDLQTLISEYMPFAAAYRENPNIMRFRFYRPLEIQEQLLDLQREPLHFTAAEDYNPQRRFFISTNELDAILRGGKHNTDYRLSVYSFYLNHTDKKEREKFLKDYHGEYSGSHSGNDNLTYQRGKGLFFSHGDISKPYAKVELKWNAVEKRINALIASEKFISEADRKAIPAYERHQLARNIYSFFDGVGQEQPHPYPYGFEYWNAVKIIEQQLDDPAKVEEIYQMMLPAWEVTQQDDRHYKWRKKGFDALCAYRDGTYSLFGERKPLSKIPEIETVKAEQPIIGDSQDDADFIETEFSNEQAELEYFNNSNVQSSVSVGERLRSLMEQAEDAVSNSEQAIAFREDVDRLLLDKDGDSLVGITADVWVEKLAAMTPNELGTYISTYEKGMLDDFSVLNQEKSLAPPKPRREHIRFTTLHPEIPKEERHDFQITDKQLGEGTPTEKYHANVAAIRTLQLVEAENRLATPDEQETLSKYVGWGGLADCFDEKHRSYLELKELLPEEEYASARASPLTAFYTSPVIIKSIYEALSQMGFEKGNILEPSCGVGNFIGMLPESMKNSNVYGVELDSVSGRIAQQLYQSSNISVNGFEKVEMPDSFFDVAIGNVPFGDFKVLDRRYDKNHWLIHDYFFGKTLDKVRPGGIVAFITSKGTLDKENSAVRKYLAQRADLIGAIRLPDNAFKRNAGTEVTSDIIFLQKRDRIMDIEPEWVQLDTDENGIKMNSYFVQHPEMVLGEMAMESTRFGMDSACKAYGESDLGELLEEAIPNLHAQISNYEIDELEDEDTSIPADPDVRNFSYTIVDGKVYYRENSRMHPVEVSVTAENRIRGMIQLRDCVRQLIFYQTEDYPDELIKKEQATLNRLYDNYVKKYDCLFTRGNSLAFREDSSYCLLCSLEILDDEGNFKSKADMFTKRTIKPHIAITSVDTASDALAVSISEKAKVDMEFMSVLSGLSEEELEADLKGIIFRDINCATDPTDIPAAFMDIKRFALVTVDEYFSGNVRKKLQMASALENVLPAEEKSKVQDNIKGLEAVQPTDLTAGEISVRIGATWVPPEIYRQFAFETFGTSSNAQNKINVLYSKCTGAWNVTKKNADYINIKAVTAYGTKRINAYEIFEQTLNLKDVRIFDTVYEDGTEKRVLNKKETAIAQDKQEFIKSKFAEWVWKDIDRREKLCRIYNDLFNSIRPRVYDGQHIRFSGINPEIALREHQINAIARIMYGGNTLLAHEVGAGKTYEMVAAAMESKRLALCSKSLIVVPNHIIDQWAAEWLRLYPSANILAATKKDFEMQNRKKFCARIATGEFDAIIIGHSQFEKIPMSKERQEIILQQQIDEVLNGIQDARAEGAERYTIKQMEKTKKSLENRLEKLNDQSRKDNVVTFEELGVDRIFIDESHYYKNLFLMTKMRNVGGIGQTEAQKSSDLFMKCQYLDELTNNHGVIFATGTPISNSMVELYTIQRYLQYRVLQGMGLQHFDEWAASFGETVTAIELSPEGTGYRAKTRFAKFCNLPELMSMFREVADIQTADMLNLPVPKANFHTEVIKPTELQKEMVKGLADRAEAVRNRLVDPRIDNMLKITNDGRKLALDMRLINSLAADDENNKTSTCARNVHSIWENTKEQRSTQLVFCDISTPKNDGSFNVYDDLKQKLMAKGIPAEEIAFIHEATTEAKKEALFAKVRSGQIRVLMGSTQKMGAGTNVQDKLVALHDLDCPWRPSDLAQRLGRIIRQGNANPEVDIFRYVTENTFDAYMYQLVENKQKFISQIMTGKTLLRIVEDVDETALSYAEIKALATGNPLIIEKCNLELEVSKLNVLKSSYLNQKYALEEMVLRKYPETITRLEERAMGYEKDNQLIVAHPKLADVFSPMEIGGITYTEKEAAGKAILDACTKMTGSDAVHLGQYRGFSITLAYNGGSNEYRMSMKGTLSHTAVLGADIFGNITRMDNVLDGFEDKHKIILEELEDTNKQLENARVEMEEPFAKDAELVEKAARLKELNILLNMDQKDRSVLNSEPDESDGKEKVKKPVNLER